jgi:hypothetical protein
MPDRKEIIEVAGRSVPVSNPDKVYFPQTGHTKLDLVRVDLDPVPGVDWAQIIRVALLAREVLADFGLTGWPKTSGSRGMHVYARIEPRWAFADVRRAAVALAREIERRAPRDATSKWWKEERHGPTGRRRSTMPLIEIARAATKDEAMQGLDRWKQRHPEAWSRLEPADVLVDSMRGRSSTWTRIRLNLRNVPEVDRPPQEPLEVDYDPWARGG